jgi:HK97 family phage portal protein
VDYLGSNNALNALSGFNGSLPIYDTNIQGSIVSPATINPYSILTIPAYWRAINFKANNLTSFPRSVRQNGIQLDQTHRLDRVLSRRPNNYQNPTSFWKTLFFHRAHYGNGFARIKRPKIGTGVDSLHNLLPDDVVPFRYAPDSSDPTDWQQYYAVRSTQEILYDADVIHLSALSYDGMAALSPVWMFRETFQRALQQDRYLNRSLMRGTVMRGAIQIPAGATPEQQLEIVNLIRTYFSGADAERDVIVLSGGATLNNATLSMEQSQMIQQTTYTTKQISQITAVHPHFLFDDSEGKYNANVQQAGEDVVRFTFRPEIEDTEDELTLKLLPPAEQDQGFHVHIDPHALLRGDTETQTAVVLSKVTAGIITKNEGRADLGYARSEDPDADKLKTLGDTAPPKPDPQGGAIKNSSDAADTRQLFTAAMKPLIEDACRRVDAKTDKAFQRKAEKPAEERTIWGNVFATEQESYAHECLRPVVTTIEQVTGEKIDLHRIAERYSAAVRKRAADGTAKTLSEIVIEVTGEKNGNDA